MISSPLPERADKEERGSASWRRPSFLELDLPHPSSTINLQHTPHSPPAGRSGFWTPSTSSILQNPQATVGTVGRETQACSVSVLFVLLAGRDSGIEERGQGIRATFHRPEDDSNHRLAFPLCSSACTFFCQQNTHTPFPSPRIAHRPPFTRGRPPAWLQGLPFKLLPRRRPNNYELISTAALKTTATPSHGK